MKTYAMILAAATVLLLTTSNAHAGDAAGGFGFNAQSVRGAPTGEVLLAGGGAFDATTGFLKMGGAFRCVADIAQGPLSGCRAGEGARWEGLEILPSTNFKCGGIPDEAVKTAFTDDHTVVMQVAFYRQGDGIEPSFTAKMFVSTDDEAADGSGTQNVWIEGVGCGTARVNFR
jgi:hypothetical protein